MWDAILALLLLVPVVLVIFMRNAKILNGLDEDEK